MTSELKFFFFFSIERAHFVLGIGNFKFPSKLKRLEAANIAEVEEARCIYGECLSSLYIYIYMLTYILLYILIR